MHGISMPPPVGKNAPVLRIANEHWMSFGCARGFRRSGGELAITLSGMNAMAGGAGPAHDCWEKKV